MLRKSNLESKSDTDFELSRCFRWISATISNPNPIKSQFEYDLKRNLAGGRLDRISLLGCVM